MLKKGRLHLGFGFCDYRFINHICKIILLGRLINCKINSGFFLITTVLYLRMWKNQESSASSRLYDNCQKLGVHTAERRVPGRFGNPGKRNFFSGMSNSQRYLLNL